MLLVCVSSITILLYSSTHTVIIIISIVYERLYLSYYHYCHIIVIKSIFYASSATSTTQIVIRYYSFAATPVVRKNIHCGWVSEAYTETRWSKTRRRRNKLKYCLLVRWRTIRYKKRKEPERQTRALQKQWETLSKNCIDKKCWRWWWFSAFLGWNGDTTTEVVCFPYVVLRSIPKLQSVSSELYFFLPFIPLQLPSIVHCLFSCSALWIREKTSQQN